MTERRIAVDFWGVEFAIEWTNPQLDDQMTALVLPNWRPRQDLRPDAVFRLSDDEGGEPRLEVPADVPFRVVTKSTAVDTLERTIQLYIGSKTRKAVFVHAAVLGWNGGALVFPGQSFAGKSTLTKALAEAGMTYYSDEYAIIDGEGLVHPFPRRLSLRYDGFLTERLDAAAQGWAVGSAPLPLRAVLACSFSPEAVWQANPISRGAGVLKLLGNTVSAQAAPELAIEYLTRAIGNATVYESERGEASETARLLMEHFSEAWS